MSNIKAGLYGLCVADALGVPAESRTRESLRNEPITGMSSGGIRQQNVGYWSDDSSMTLCLADSIAEVGYFHTHDIMERFRAWFFEGSYTPGGKMFDYGHTCAKAIYRYVKGCTPALCGSNKINENGNGSLMRILPMAYVLYGKYGKDITDHKRAMEDIHKISGLTHRHPLAKSACGIYLAIVCRLLGGEELNRAIWQGTEKALAWYRAHQPYDAYVHYWDDLKTLRYRPEDSVRSGGYVVETLETVLWCLIKTDSYKDCVLRCVNMGYDTDSTAAIAGGLAGIYYGYNNIPADWVEQLAGKDIIDKCVSGVEHFCKKNNKHDFETYWDYNRIRRADRSSVWNTLLDLTADKRDIDKFRGCLIGGAAGDALGYEVEFYDEEELFNRFGDDGIKEFRLHGGRALISDNTQMSLFTANGLLYGHTRACLRGISGRTVSYIAEAYREWYITQMQEFPVKDGESCCWLMNVPEFFEKRYPGNTCMHAIGMGCGGSIEEPINGSCGCGGVMRVAPIGLFYGQSHRAGQAADLLAADAAALTHGHELGYIPAAMLAHVVRLLSHSDKITPREAVMDSIEAVKRLFPYAVHLDELLDLIGKAVKLSENAGCDLDAIHELGEGWRGDEALAIAVYCALKYSDDFEMAVLAAANHGGNSDTTGSITGNILGAYLGLSKIPKKFTENLELLDVITELADDLYYGCPLDEYEAAATEHELAWERKYVYVS